MRTVTKLARHLNSRHPAGRALPALLLLSDEVRLPDPRAAAAALPRGSGVVLRNYGDSRRADLGRALSRLCRARGLVLLVAGDGALAVKLGADGLHLREDQIHLARRWRRRRARWLITASAHGLPALRRAAAAGCDAALLAPVFATASHPGRTPLGVVRFAALAGKASLPVYALGGVGPRGAARLRGTAAIGIAAIGALASPGQAARVRSIRGADGSRSEAPAARLEPSYGD